MAWGRHITHMAWADQEGNTPLWLACTAGLVSIVNKLIAAGADKVWLVAVNCCVIDTALLLMS